MLQGPYGSLDRDRPLIRLPFTSLAVATVLLPFTGLIACLFISLVYHFEDATYTHCQVGGVMAHHGESVGLSSRNELKVSGVREESALPLCDLTLRLCLFRPLSLQVSNYLPSISAAISRVPERYIWRCCIGLHSAPRYLVAAAYFNFYHGRFAKRVPELLLSGLALLCSLSENTGLLLLTYVSSTETYSECGCGRARPWRQKATPGGPSLSSAFMS